MLSTGKCHIEDIRIYVYGVLMIFNEDNFEADFPCTSIQPLITAVLTSMTSLFLIGNSNVVHTY